jgi:uncharacterized protein
MDHLICREAELSRLWGVFDSDEAEFVAVYGRRRVGKTFLIRQFIAQKKLSSFQLTGIHRANITTQLGEFKRELETFYQSLNVNVKLDQPSSWLAAFELLTSALSHANKKVVLFFDEFPWMANKKSKLLEALDYYWNRYWVDNPHIKLVICGSAASWIIDNILNNKGGLHNRVTMRLPIEPFTLIETQVFLRARGVELAPAQILKLYMCFGGIPFYLKAVKKGLSAIQNINEICFSEHALLLNEFNNLFSSLFKHSERHEAIVKLLATKRQGVNRADIEAKTQCKGGALTRVLNELKCAGFIQRFTPWGKKRSYYFKLVDEYSLFYLNWISPPDKTVHVKSLSEHFWDGASQSQAWRAWAGLAFESVCFKHLDSIKKSFNIPESAYAYSWQYVAPKKSGLAGAQIDLLFERDDGIVNICEIKYSDSPFKIDQAYAQNLKHKINTYKAVSKTTKQVVLSMITTAGLADSVYTQGLVWSDISLADLFT